MLQSFNELNLNTFIDLARLKKPSKVVVTASKMIVMLVSAFNE